MSDPIAFMNSLLIIGVLALLIFTILSKRKYPAIYFLGCIVSFLGVALLGLGMIAFGIFFFLFALSGYRKQRAIRFSSGNAGGS